MLRRIVLVRHIPAWMPGAGFKRLADETRGSVIAVHKEPYALVEHAVVSERDGNGESTGKLTLYMSFIGSRN